MNEENNNHSALMRILKLTFLASQLFIFNGICQQEQLRFDHISLEQGLSQSTVFTIAQDSTGFMWFGTEDGLNRFDGYFCTVYRSSPLDSNTISDIGIRKLFVDRSGKLWIITLSGKLDRYDPAHDSFIHYEFTNITSPASKIRVVDITEDWEGKLWCGSGKGMLFSYDINNDRFNEFHLNVAKNLPEEIHLQCLYADRSGTMWLSTWEGLIELNLSSSELRLYNSLSQRNSIGGNLIFDISEDSSGRLWLASADGGVSVFDRENNLFRSFRYSPENKSGISSDRILSIYSDRYSNIWIGTLDRGVDLIRTGENMFTNYRHNPGYKFSIGNGAIFSIFEDRSGSIWFGTSSGGVSKYDRKRQNFSQISHDVTDASSLSSNVILSICADSKGALWIGTDGGGLNMCLPGENKFKHFFKNTSEFASNSVTTVYEDRSGKIWVGTDPGINSSAGFVFNYDRKSDSFFKFDKISLGLGGIAAFFEDSYGDLWIGTSADGVRRYIKSKGLITEYKYDLRDSASLSGNSAFEIFEDSYGDLWIGTIQKGLNKFIRSNGTFKRYLYDSQDSSTISNNSVWCITEDYNGTLWLGTWGGGLNMYLRESESFRHLTIEDGLPSNVIYAIIPDSTGNLWISSSRGISRFNTLTMEIKNFDGSDGLQNLEFNQGSFAKGKDGTLYFGGTNGITHFNPEALIENEFAPKIVFTDFRVFDNTYPLEASLNYVEEITLSYQQNFFSFEFAALDYTAPEKNEYMYMLEGVDKDWVRSGTRRFANYTDVAPGEYTFRVKGSNNDGIWSKNEAAISIVITPPFWQTWWFRIIGLAFIAAVLYAIHKYRLNKLLEIERTRLRIARDLHDDVSATITGMVYFSDAIDKEVGENKSPMLKKLLSLIHESATNVQESMSDIIWSINPENDKWKSVLPKFRRYVSDLCESRGINYKIHIPESVNKKPLDMERRRNLWLIYKEMVTNTFKHSECTELTILILIKDDKLNLIVSDNGKGFDPGKLLRGNGVKNIHSRSKVLNGEVQLTTSSGNGTRWELSIPV